MPKGSLDGLLYPHGDNGGGGGGLDFAQIMGIVSDVAEGMAYLHHYVPVRVVHCDLKPSNVLLNEGMRAMISDFSIARLVAGEASSTSDESAPCTSITGLLQGSVRYIAPGTFTPWTRVRIAVTGKVVGCHVPRSGNADTFLFQLC